MLKKKVYVTGLSAEQVKARLHALLASQTLTGALKDGEALIRLHGILGLGAGYSRTLVSWFACKVRIAAYEGPGKTRIILEVRPLYFAFPFLLIFLFVLVLFLVLLSFLLVAAALVAFIMVVRTSYLEACRQRAQFFAIVKQELQAGPEEANDGLAVNRVCEGGKPWD